MRPWPPAVAGCWFCSALARRGSCHPSSELRIQTKNPGRTNARAPATGSPSTAGTESVPAIGSPRTSWLAGAPLPHRPNLFVAGAAPCWVLAVLPIPRASIHIRSASDFPQSRQTAPRRRLGRARRENRGLQHLSLTRKTLLRCGYFRLSRSDRTVAKYPRGGRYLKHRPPGRYLTYRPPWAAPPTLRIAGAASCCGSPERRRAQAAPRFLPLHAGTSEQRSTLLRPV
jgi:hypothetical protein